MLGRDGVGWGRSSSPQFFKIELDMLLECVALNGWRWEIALRIWSRVGGWKVKVGSGYVSW
jgi:hypothetical protein